MKTPIIIKSDYHKGMMSKARYINRMYTTHSLLFEYADFIKNTDISNIEISDKSVIMTTRYSHAKFKCAENDKRIAPIEILNFNDFESYEFKLIHKILKPKSVFFDIGANIGWYSVNISKLLPRIPIYAFEPIPITYKLLRANIMLNNLHNISSYNLGFSNNAGKQTFFYNPEGSGNASAANLTPSKRTVRVTCKIITVDNFVHTHNIRTDVIKCDVEGGELFVFEGAKNTIMRDHPVIFTEMLRKWSRKFHYNPNDIIKLMKQLGYTCYAIGSNRLKMIPKMNNTTTETNFVFLHDHSHKRVLKILSDI